MVSRREFIKFLTGLGLGASAIELYERLYDIPLLEKSFRAEINYWMNKYNKANEEMKKIESEKKSLSQSLKENQEKVSELTQTLSYEDELEKESTSAIAFYKQQMNEAISKLKQTIEKYRILLGDERISFELASLKVLEDFHITKENLDKVIKYFPLIKNLSFVPTKIINDKIYDLNVNLEVISPINTLEKVEVKLIPVEYDYFITDYGMRKEDYPLVFPPEETRVVKLNISGLEKEIFEVNFKDLKGGREYLIKAEVKDVGGNIKTEEIKTPYIREFERKIPSNYLIGASYMTFWDVYWENSPAGRWKEIGTVYEPILGQYSSRDRIVIDKHIDWATGHGIGFFYLDFGWIRPDSPFDKVARECVLKSDLADSINFTIFYHSDAVVDQIWSKGRSALFSDFSFLAENYFKYPSYLKVDNKMVVHIVNLPWYWKEFGVKETNNLFKDLKNYIKDRYGYKLFLTADVWPNLNPSFLDDPNLPFDGIFNWGNMWGSMGNIHATYDEYANKYVTYWREWSSLAKRHNLYFIPLIFPGFDNEPFIKVGQEHRCIRRDLKKFHDLLQVTKEVTTPSLNMIMIDTYNNFQEGSSIECTKEYGSTYLDAVENAFV